MPIELNLITVCHGPAILSNALQKSNTMTTGYNMRLLKRISNCWTTNLFLRNPNCRGEMNLDTYMLIPLSKIVAAVAILEEGLHSYTWIT